MPCLQSLRHGERARAWGGRKRKCAIPAFLFVTPGENDWSKLLTSCCGVWAAPARHRAPRCAQSTQHSHSTERTVRIQSDQRKSVWTLRVMQFDVPNRIRSSHLNQRLPGRGAVGWSRPSPRDAGTSVGTWVGMCAAFVCNRPTGRGTRPGTRAETREQHDRATARSRTPLFVCGAPEDSAC